MQYVVLCMTVGCTASVAGGAEVQVDAGFEANVELAWRDDGDEPTAGEASLVGFRYDAEVADAGADSAPPAADAALPGADGAIPGVDSASPGVDSGPPVPGLCEPCESACDGDLLCVDYGSIGHTPSEGHGSFCLPVCEKYFADDDENLACRAVFIDHHCTQTLGACRPTGYDGAVGVADQCAAFLSP